MCTSELNQCFPELIVPPRREAIRFFAKDNYLNTESGPGSEKACQMVETGFQTVFRAAAGNNNKELTMSVKIKTDLCIGCGRCIDLCPGNLIKRDADTGAAYLKRPRDCWGCASCVKVCPAGAISYYLGADLGGLGMEMTVSFDGDYSIWNFEKPDGSRKQITVDRRASNQY